MTRSDPPGNSIKAAFEAGAGPPHDTLIGKLLSRGTYRVIAGLDEGGMGKLYRAEHLRLHRQVAVKVLSHELSGNQEALTRFRREAEIISQLEHPNIVHILDYDTTEEGEPYIVMELLSGESLARYLHTVRIVPLRDAVAVVSQVASALATAHRGGVVHRDLKPDNVFVVAMRDGSIFVKLLDFGISRGNDRSTRVTGKYDILGTPEYMAPEQALETAKADHLADQWSLACITYEMLTGHVPFTGENAVHVLAKIVRESPPPLTYYVPAVPAVIEEVVLRGLSKDPRQRFPTISEFAEHLAKAAEVVIEAEAPLAVPHAMKVTAPAASAPTLASNHRKRTTKQEARLAPTAELSRRSRKPDATAPLPAPVASFDAPVRPKFSPARVRSALPSTRGEDSARFESDRIRRQAAVTPAHPALPTTKSRAGKAVAPSNPKNKTPNNLESIMDELKRAMGQHDVGRALEQARSALRLMRQEPAGPPRALSIEALELVQSVFLQALGGKHRKLHLVAAPPTNQGGLNPTHMFLVSRIEGSTTIEELLDISPLPDLETLDILLGFSDQGLLSID